MAEGWRGAGRLLAVAGALGALIVLGLALVLGGAADEGAQPATPGGSDRAGVADRFARLSLARTNRCDLSASELRGMADGRRLQGSCCFPMDRAGYEEQVRELRGYRPRRVIPRDPYDVPIAMAKRLLAYRGIALDRQQRAAYQRAKRSSELGGPCCCPCWRWQAFKGQAHFLLARRGWSAAQVARLWEHEEGCGGAHEHA